jgi:hypothetical protein
MTKLTIVLFVGFVQAVTPPANQAAPATSEVDSELKQDLERLKHLADSGNLDNFKANADAMLGKWAGRNLMEYSSAVYQIATLLRSADFPDRDRQSTILRAYVVGAIEKGDALPIDTELRLLLVLPTNASADRQDWPRSRSMIAQFWLRAWQRLDEELKKPFDRNDLPEENIRPPAATGLPAGVSPEAIRDSALRVEYEKALGENNRKAEHFRLRLALERLELPFKETAKGYVSTAYATPPLNLEELVRYLETYVSSKDVRSSVVDEVKKKTAQ